ncbi:DnaJ domain-containing protein [Phenylobacterium sp. 20VBR1]|uniref:DnaJ domain-containing protein n=1 Tax=Phenylobacterium glaciei TaxID=2803784 RepID=A0A941HXC3_9CAUL|nr:DnaJ domain-containing protein [Phenylobacterium glaciei]MBR7620941.1 DnaJ domain-containing protein [Phenylobacterium glaciei]
MAGETSTTMSAKRAREVLGAGPLAGPAELRRAFREAAKRAHPDRKGGDAERFREVVEAYHILQTAPAPRDRVSQPPATVARPMAASPTLAVPPLIAMTGGKVEHRLPDGRRVKIDLPPGMRAGDTVRAGNAELEVAIRGDGEMMVRGDDLWITVKIEPRLLAEGGRIGVETPLGRRVVWLTKKAGERGLIRLVGQGLPSRGRHRQGHLFLRLAADSVTSDSAARAQLRRFAAAWAA